MYIPSTFQVTDNSQLHELMEAYNFAAVLTVDPDGLPFATHMPLMLERERGPYGTLVGHMARANPQWRHFQADQDILVMFQGPHAYISPSWYVGAFNVPTWNYAVVHAYGVPRIVEEAGQIQAMLDALVDHHEKTMATPWTADWADPRHEKLIKAVVGFELPITRLEGKFKLNQNKSQADQKGVIQAVDAADHPDGPAMAQLMTRNL